MKKLGVKFVIDKDKEKDNKSVVNDNVYSPIQGGLCFP